MLRFLPIATLGLLVCFNPWRRAPHAPLSEDRELPSLIPKNCLVFVEARELAPWIDSDPLHPFLASASESPLAAALLAKLPISPRELLVRTDAWLGGESLATLRALVEGGLAFGFEPESRGALIVAHGRDDASVDQGLRAIFGALERHFGFPGAFAHPHRQRAGADLWNLGEDVLVGRRNAWVWVSNEEDLLFDALDLAQEEGGLGLLERPEFVACRAACPADAHLWSWAQMEELEAFGDAGFQGLRAAPSHPAVQALLGSTLAGLLGARATALAVHLERSHLELTAQAYEAPVSTPLVVNARAGEHPASLSTKSLSEALVYRDYAAFFAHSQELFPAEFLPGFAEALANGALFFEGRNLDEVLAQLSPWMRVVVRAVEFSPERDPEAPLPAAALVAVLSDQSAGDAWVSAFQSVVAISNVDQAQKGGKALRLHLVREGTTDLSVARYASPRPGEGVDLRFNLEPAVAVVGRHLILGTHQSLVAELVRELATATPEERSDGRESWEVRGRGWRSFVDRNFELLVSRKRLEEGLDRPAAEAEIELLRLALESLDAVRVEVTAPSTSPTALRIEVDLKTRELPR